MGPLMAQFISKRQLYCTWSENSIAEVLWGEHATEREERRLGWVMPNVCHGTDNISASLLHAPTELQVSLESEASGPTFSWGTDKQ